MGRPKGSTNKAPSKPRATRATAPAERKPSAATRKAMDRASAAVSSNGINNGALREVWEILGANHDKRLTVMGEALNACRQLHMADKDALKDAKSRGVPVRAVKTAFKLWLLQVKEDKIRADLEPDDQQLLAMVEQGLGFEDTPLGRAAFEVEKVVASSSASGLSGSDVAAENARRLGEGIHQLAEAPD